MVFGFQWEKRFKEAMGMRFRDKGISVGCHASVSRMGDIFRHQNCSASPPIRLVLPATELERSNCMNGSRFQEAEIKNPSFLVHQLDVGVLKRTRKLPLFPEPKPANRERSWIKQPWCWCWRVAGELQWALQMDCGCQEDACVRVCLCRCQAVFSKKTNPPKLLMH